jgi:hypothetical protein
MISNKPLIPRMNITQQLCRDTRRRGGVAAHVHLRKCEIVYAQKRKS